MCSPGERGFGRDGVGVLASLFCGNALAERPPDRWRLQTGHVLGEGMLDWVWLTILFLLAFQYKLYTFIVPNGDVLYTSPIPIPVACGHGSYSI